MEQLKTALQDRDEAMKQLQKKVGNSFRVFYNHHTWEVVMQQQWNDHDDNTSWGSNGNMLVFVCYVDGKIAHLEPRAKQIIESLRAELHSSKEKLEASDASLTELRWEKRKV